MAQIGGTALRGCIGCYWSDIIKGAMITAMANAAMQQARFKKLILKVNTKYLGRDVADI